MRRHITLAPVLALIAGLLLVLAPSPAQAADRDCGDFSTQAEAQRFYEANGGPGSDPHRLDSDSDGEACETLPCPCGSGGGGGTVDPAPAREPKRIVQYGRVVKVVDGDTLDVRLHRGKTKRVRMIGIDTPEVYGGTECGGRKASRSLKRLLPRGTRVKLVSDTSQDNKDRYGRLLRYVIKRSTGKDMNRSQIWRGWATVYVYGGDPFNRVSSYRRAQRKANSNDRGIWRICR